MGKALQLAGRKFGRLTVVARANKNKSGNWKWWTVCQCGECLIVAGSNLKSNGTKSCGCFSRFLCKNISVTHGKWGTPEYKSWAGMKDRCLNLNSKYYKDYGGRGIKVCERWLKFENFFEDMGLKPSSELTLERIDNEKGYFFKNCSWKNSQIQARNRRIRKDNTTGCTGVCWHVKKKKYQVAIKVNYKNIYLGQFIHLVDAIDARKLAEIKYWGKSNVK